MGAEIEESAAKSLSKAGDTQGLSRTGGAKEESTRAVPDEGDLMPTKADRWLKSAESRMSSVRGIIFSFLVIVGFLLIVGTVVATATRDLLYVEPVSVPEELQKAGLTPEVVARRLVSELHRLRIEARLPYRRLGGPRITPTWSLPEATVAGARYSLFWVTRLIRPTVSVKGEVVTDGGNVELRLHLGRFGLPKIQARALKDIDQVIADGAVAIARQHEPCTYASTMHNRWRDAVLSQPRDENLVRARDAAFLNGLDRCLNDDARNNAALAFTLWGRKLTEEQQFDEAYDKFARAIREDPGLVVAHVEWGIAIEANRSIPREIRRSQAIEKYKSATKVEPRYAPAWYHWAQALRAPGENGAAGSVDEALRVSERAAAENVHSPLVPYVWGRSLCDKGDRDGAVAKYRDALALTPDFSAALQERERALKDGCPGTAHSAMVDADLY